MDNHKLMEIEELVNKLKQHEELITQLLEIIASTNRRVHELTNNQIKDEISTLTENVH